jgi:hypothetical protein
MLSEISHTQKDKCFRTPLIQSIQKRHKSQEVGQKLPGTWRRENGELYIVFVWNDEKC